VHALVRPGELNLMTAGHGIAHSEVSTADTTLLHGVQLWIALPDSARDTPRAFDHHVPEPVSLPGASVRVLLGSLAASTSPVHTHSPLLGAEIVLEPHARLELDIDPGFEHAVLVDAGPVELAGTELKPAELGYQAAGSGHLRLANPTAEPARAMLLGGAPFTEPLLMWWNFVGRTHEEIVQFRQEWAAGSGRFGDVAGYTGSVARLPAPELPRVRIKARLSPPGPGDRSAWG
jgi:redox-sensitive bicupin YhaK (pirin superfamily)